MPRRASAFGRAPTTSPRPPVLANGAHSEATKSTAREGDTGPQRSGGVEAVVEVREDVVARLDLREPRHIDPPAAELLEEPVEAQDVVVHAPGGVRHGAPRAHEDRPVAPLREHELARGWRRARARTPSAARWRCASSTMRSA